MSPEGDDALNGKFRLGNHPSEKNRGFPTAWKLQEFHPFRFGLKQKGLKWCIFAAIPGDVDSLSRNSCKIAAIPSTRSSPRRQRCLQKAIMPPEGDDAPRIRRGLLDPVKSSRWEVYVDFSPLHFLYSGARLSLENILSAKIWLCKWTSQPLRKKQGFSTSLEYTSISGRCRPDYDGTSQKHG